MILSQKNFPWKLLHHDLVLYCKLDLETMRYRCRDKTALVQSRTVSFYRRGTHNTFSFAGCQVKMGTSVDLSLAH